MTLHSPVSFLAAEHLWLLTLLPVAAGLYWLLLRRRKRVAVRYGNFGMLKQALGSRGRLRQHIPPTLFLIAITLLILGIARPAAVMSVSSNKSTVILTMDVSGSMRSQDVKPSRVEAMQAAAKTYVGQQPKEVRIGIVAFASSAFLVQSPTTDHAILSAAIDRFRLQRGTAVGSGILMSLATLFPDEDFSVGPFASRDDPFDPSPSGSANRGTPLGEGAKKKPALVEPGSNKSSVIILLTDGATNAGPDPVEAARQAANHGVRVYTVGFGTTGGDIVGFEGRRWRAELDEDSLKRIADMTRAQYYRASNAQELEAIYKLLSTSLVTERKENEITWYVTAAATVVLLLAAGLSLLWFSRVL
jgi:Ca-activated chloride channel family protein